MALQLAAITLPTDMQWIDEFAWSPVAQQVEVTCGGSLMVEESAQLAGRPVTLEGRQDGDKGFGWADRATIVALNTLSSIPQADPLVLLLHDGRSFNVRFRYSDGAPVQATPLVHLAPQIDVDRYLLTLRLMQV